MAGAIEAVASTSGQIMPPVLGLAAFIIAVFLNVPYMDVALAGLIPALLFLSGVTCGVLVNAYQENIPKLSETIDTEAIKRLLPTFILSFSVVLILLLGYYSPSFAGLLGIAVALAVCPLQGKYRPTRKALFDSFSEGLALITLLSLLLIAVGPLAQTFQTTNLAQRLGVLLSQVVPDSKLLMLTGAMVVSLLLGMGLPTPVAYLVVALSLVPFIMATGVEAIVAHFFVFYFAVFSTLTPPVAISALAAAKLSGGPFLGTCLDAMKLMLTTFIIPFAFSYHPQLLKFPNIGWDVLPPVALIIVLQITTSIACYGYFFGQLTWIDRCMFALLTVAGLFLLIGWSQIEFVGVTVILLITILRFIVFKRKSSNNKV